MAARRINRVGFIVLWLGRFWFASLWVLRPCRVGRGRGGVSRALASVRIPTLVVSIDSDGLYPPVEQQELARLIPGAKLQTLRSQHGHDGFLIEMEQLERQVRTFRDKVECRKVVRLCAGGAA